VSLSVGGGQARAGNERAHAAASEDTPF